MTIAGNGTVLPLVDAKLSPFWCCFINARHGARTVMVNGPFDGVNWTYGKRIFSAWSIHSTSSDGGDGGKRRFYPGFVEHQSYPLVNAHTILNMN